tara:strand:+ start:477 stop:803 length:327 start_codon:yes stop_codon:yes gene_type:complete
MSIAKNARKKATLRYERHKPEQTLLYQIIEKYYPQFLTHMARGFVCLFISVMLLFFVFNNIYFSIVRFNICEWFKKYFIETLKNNIKRSLPYQYLFKCKLIWIQKINL